MHLGWLGTASVGVPFELTLKAENTAGRRLGLGTFLSMSVGQSEAIVARVH